MNGAFSNKNTIAYVIDGIVLNDVDAYSIYDIEKMVLVQNSVAQVSGANNTQMMVIISTRKPVNESAASPQFNFAAQAGPVFRNNGASIGPSKATGVFHQYFGSALGGGPRFKYGASVNFLHDVLPSPSSPFNFSTQPQFNLLRGNVWMQAALSKNHQLDVNLGYAPQWFDSRYSGQTNAGVVGKGWQDKDESLFSAQALLRSQFGKGFYNKLSVAYIKGKLDEIESRDNTPGWSGGAISNNFTSYNIALSNSFGFIKKWNNWSFNPSVNASYQSYEINNRSAYSDFGGGMSVAENRGKGEIYSLSNSLSVSYKKYVNALVGWVLDAAPMTDGEFPEDAYPFASLTVNLLTPGEKAKNAWQVFGSVAQSFMWMDNTYKISDFAYRYSYGFSALPVVPGYVFSDVPILSSVVPNDYKAHWQLGTRFATHENRVILNYNFSKYETPATAIFPTGSGSVFGTGRFHGARHHFAVTAKALQSEALSWTPELYANLVKNQYDFNSQIVVSSAATAQTGGIVNRAMYKSFSAGVDVQYLFYDYSSTNSNVMQGEKFTSFQLQHIFVAYTFKTSRFKNLEPFISARNLIDSKKHPLSGTTNKFVVAGFTVGL